MQVKNEIITVGVKTDKFGPTLRVGEEWIKTSKELFEQLEKGKTYTVEMVTNDKGKKNITKIVRQEDPIKESPKPSYEKKVEASSKGEFRSPNQIMRSSAIGVALSFVSQSLQNDIETPIDKKIEIAFDLAKKVEGYIEGE